MNILKGEITAIHTHLGLSLVSLQVGEFCLKSIVLETPDSVPYLKLKQTVNILFKETEVLLAYKEGLKISSQNQFIGKVENIDTGKILSEVTLTTTVGLLKSIVTTNAIHDLNIQTGDELVALVKTNEVMLSE